MRRPLKKRAFAKCKHKVTLQDRNIVPPKHGTADFDEKFTDKITVRAIVKTVRGKTYFDGINTERAITHEIKIEYIKGVTAETWLFFKGRRIDILAVENCCEADEVLVFTCNDRGDAAKPASRL